MESKSRISHIWQEIMCHAPFTAAGAVTGVLFMLLFRNIGSEVSGRLFSIFHPAHVVLSAMVTTSLFALHSSKKNIIAYVLIGYIGSVGIATLSDSVIPYMGEEIMGISVPTESAVHSHEHEHDETGLTSDHDEHDEHEPHGLYLGFIEEWYIVNPAAFLGIAIAWYMPRSRYPHAAHILISTWASSAHMLMNTQVEITFVILVGMFFVLFVAVWLPCCVSDIVFPLLFVKGDIDISCRCNGPRHSRGGHSESEEKGHRSCSCDEHEH